MILGSSNALPTGHKWINLGLALEDRARICKPFKEPRNRLLPAWRNRFLGFINLNKWGFWGMSFRWWNDIFTANPLSAFYNFYNMLSKTISTLQCWSLLEKRLNSVIRLWTKTSAGTPSTLIFFYVCWSLLWHASHEINSCRYKEIFFESSP